ncbi:MAG: hypothetical protein WC465_00275 [Patescibacteria group bacterium]
MTNQEKIERFRQIFADFLATLNKLKKVVADRSANRVKAQEKAKIDELLAKINKDY